MVSVGLVPFQIALYSSLHFSISIGPFWCSQLLPTGILICCTGHFWSGSLCLFGFCLPLSTVSTFRPDTSGRRWSLLQVHLFSRAAGREGRCRQISLACVGSTPSVLATLGLPLLATCVLPPSTLLRLQAALHGAGPELHALPRPKPLRFRFSGTT